MILVFATEAAGQEHLQSARRPDTSPVAAVSPSAHDSPSSLSILKRPGRYSATAWQTLIDSVWGTGLATSTKLAVFDRFWNLVDQTWGGFPNLTVNWDSLGNVYRPIVEAGVSRGRFSGILSCMTRALNEWHVMAMDAGIDSAMGYIYWTTQQYPNFSKYRYRPGIPLLNINPITFRTPFGAGLTPLPDNTALVYSVMPNHPLGLEPGDVILGYDGTPWLRALDKLFAAELPMVMAECQWGSTPAASNHVSIVSAGMNWGLFDTIDVVKYATKDTLHLPTSLLAAISPPYHIATEQLPVKGVPFPNIQNNKLVSWGIVEGTNIGYIYVWDWYGQPPGETRDLFRQAVDELMHTYTVQGLILDFRTNPGGLPEYANLGFGHLFNIDPTVNYSSAERVRGADHFAFLIWPPKNEQRFSPTTEIFDHPIAVLTGPLCGSSGDYNAFRLRFHPMVRFFGKPTNGGFTDPFSNQGQYGFLVGSYFCRVDVGSIFSNYKNEGYLIHKGVPVDEEVWLTRDGVAKGEDDVVKRALEWIGSVPYACHTQLAYASKDTLRITTHVKNPPGHVLNVTAILKNDAGASFDSLTLRSCGLHCGTAACDSLWSGLYAPSGESTFSVSIRTDDITAGTSRTIPNAPAIAFSPHALLAMDSRPIDLGCVDNALQRFDLNFWVRNIGADIGEVAISIDPGTVVPDYSLAVSPATFSLAPGDSQKVLLRIRPDNLPHNDFLLRVIINCTSPSGQTTFDKYIQFEIAAPTVVSGRAVLPMEFKLGQNYPNPFNPATTMCYQLPRTGHVSLTVYDVLGREVAILVNEVKQPGVYTVRWDAAGQPSGVYFYQLRAGNYIQVKRLVLIK